MARSRRTLDRRTLREQNEAVERRKQDEDVDEEEGDEEEDEDEDKGDDAEASDADADEEEGDEDDDEEERPKKKKPKPAPKPRVTKARTRTPKVTRMKVVWGVFNNSHQMIEEFEYPRKKDAEEMVVKLSADKKSGHPFFLQPVKKPIDK